MTRKELFPLLVKGMSNIYLCYCDNFKLSDIQHYLENDVEYSIASYIENTTCCVSLEDLNNLTNKFKEIIADFAGINTQQNDKDPTDQTVYLAVEALVKAYGLKSPEELLEKVKELTGNSSNGGQPDVNQAFINVNDLITANTVLNSQVESLRAQISALGIKPIV